MKIDRVTYSKKFPYAPYLNFDIGFEASLDDTDDPVKALDRLKTMVEGYYKENIELPQPPSPPEEQVQTIQVSSQIKRTKSVQEVYADEIKSCNTLSALKAWTFLSSQNAALKPIYDAKLKELSK